MIWFHIQSSSFKFLWTEDFDFKSYDSKSRIHTLWVLFVEYNLIYPILKGTKNFAFVFVLDL